MGLMTLLLVSFLFTFGYTKTRQCQKVFTFQTPHTSSRDDAGPADGHGRVYCYNPPRGKTETREAAARMLAMIRYMRMRNYCIDPCYRERPRSPCTRRFRSSCPHQSRRRLRLRRRRLRLRTDCSHTRLQWLHLLLNKRLQVLSGGTLCYLPCSVEIGTDQRRQQREQLRLFGDGNEHDDAVKSCVCEEGKDEEKDVIKLYV